MLCDEVLGNLNDPSYELVLRRELGGVFETDEVLLDWEDTRRRVLRVTSAGGVDVGIRRGDAALKNPLADGDVLGVISAQNAQAESGLGQASSGLARQTAAPAGSASGVGVPTVVVVRLKSAEVLLIEVPRGDATALAHACWEVGNMHAPLFRYESDAETVRLLTPVITPLDRMLSAIPGVRISKIEVTLDPTQRFSTRAVEAVVSLASDFRIVRKPVAGRE